MYNTLNTFIHFTTMNNDDTLDIKPITFYVYNYNEIS